jgi:hypothetical protein
MALEAVVFPQGHLAYTANVMSSVAAHSASPGCGGVDIIDEFEDKGGVVLQEEAEAFALHGVSAAATWDAELCPCSIAPGAVEERWDVRDHPVSPPPVPPALAPEHGKPASRRRRRRPKAMKNKEEVENQRRNHIAVERNRRRQMNEYLAVLRSVMPPSYAQRVRTYVVQHHPSSGHHLCRSCRLAVHVHERLGTFTASLIAHTCPLTFTVTNVKSCLLHGHMLLSRRAMPLWFLISRNL